jgi:hypothetical protein
MVYSNFKMVTLAETARLLECTAEQVLALRKSLPGFRLGGLRFYRRTDVDRVRQERGIVDGRQA